MKDKICVILTTTDSKKSAKNLAKNLLQKRLAACIQMGIIKSRYMWEKRPVCEKEYLLTIKTIAKNRKAIKRYFSKKHPYKIPEFVVLKAKSSKKYKKWLKGVLQK